MPQLSDNEQLISIALGEATTSHEQRKAIAELGKLDDQSSLDALVGLLSVDDRYLRRDVVKAIGTHGSQAAVLALIHCLSDPTENVRRDAATLLGSRDDGRAVAPLTQLLDDKGYAVRHAAETSLELLEREGIEATPLAPDALGAFSSRQTVPSTATTTQPISATTDTHQAQHSKTADALEDAVPPNPTTGPPTAPTNHEPTPENETFTSPPLQNHTTDPPAHKAATSNATQPEFPSSLTHTTPSRVDPNQNTDTSARPSTTPQPTPQPSDTNASTPETVQESTIKEDVVLAELVTETTETASSRPPSQLVVFEERHATLAVEQLMTPTPSLGFDWGSARRFKLLFGNDIANLQSHYALLYTKQLEAISSENRFEKALLTHDLVYADLADDIKANTDNANQQLKNLKQLQHDGASLAASLKRTKRASIGIASSIANYFWPTRTELLHKNAEHLKAKLKQSDEQSNRSSETLSKAQSRSNSVSQPLKAAEEELVAASEASTRLQKEVRNLGKAIDNEILSVLNNGESEAIAAFIDHSPRGEALKQCITELRRHQVEQRTLENALFELDSPLNEDKQRFTETAANIAASVAAGFTKTTRQQKVKSNVNCTVAFRSTSVTNNSSLRLDGKAQGRAELTTNYDYSEITWNGGEQLREDFNKLNNSATQLGSLQALHAIRSTEVASTAYSVNNCVAFIRSELEKDFEAKP